METTNSPEVKKSPSTALIVIIALIVGLIIGNMLPRIGGTGQEGAVTTSKSAMDAQNTINRVKNPQIALYQCNDGIDNDMDSATDFPTDSGCVSPTDNSELNPAVYQCSDGLDNDGDTKTDYPADPGCTSMTDNTE
jgi:hypothetical protein